MSDVKVFLLVAPLLLAPSAVLAEEGPTPVEVSACMARNLPQPDSVRGVRISARDRAGVERETLVKIYGRTTPEGLRQVLVEFLEPKDISGSTVLMLEGKASSETYFRADNDSKPKRITGAARALSLFGSDFTYEDFEFLLSFKRPGETQRLEDDTYMGRPVYVVESRSADSSYERIVTSIDKERCVAVKAEIYEKGRGLRKELTINPSRVIKKGGVWLPQAAVMSDLRDLSSTVMLVDSTDQDVLLDDKLFEVRPAVSAPAAD